MLRFFGIVKGKPRKQKFMSLLNDGKHVYYAAHAHIFVTSDVDLIAKAKTIFQIWGWSTNIMTPAEFKDYLIFINAQDISVAAMFEQFNNVADLPTGYEKYTLGDVYIQKDLPHWYLGEFNTFNCAIARGNCYYYFNQFFSNIDSGTMTIELERVIDKMLDNFGIDELKRGKLDRKELEEKEWKGREWRVGEMGVLLNFNHGMMISFLKLHLRLMRSTQSKLYVIRKINKKRLFLGYILTYGHIPYRCGVPCVASFSDTKMDFIEQEHYQLP